MAKIYGAEIFGNFKLQDGSEGSGYVLISDGVGIASWTSSSNIIKGIYDGSGTVPSNTTSTITDTLFFDGGATGSPTIRIDGASSVSSGNFDDVNIALRVNSSNGSPLFAIKNNGSLGVNPITGFGGLLMYDNRSLNVAGKTSDSSAYALRLENNGSNPILNARNDRRVSIGSDTFNDSSLTIVKASGTSYALTVPNSGENVGFGTSAPTEQLHIVGSLRLVDGTEANGYILTTDATGVASWTSSTIPTGVGGIYTGSGSLLGGDTTVTSATSSLTFTNSNRNILHFDNINNRIGIGTTSSIGGLQYDSGTFSNNKDGVWIGNNSTTVSYPLHIYNSSTSTNATTYLKFWAGTNDTSSNFPDNLAHGADIFADFGTRTTYGISVDPTVSTDLVFRTADDDSPVERMRILANGNIQMDSNTFYLDSTVNGLGLGITIATETVININSLSNEGGYQGVTTSGNHGYSVGDIVIFQNMGPFFSGKEFTVRSIVDSDTFTINILYTGISLTGTDTVQRVSEVEKTLDVRGSVRLADGSQGDNYVLVSDYAGIISWTASTGLTVSGDGNGIYDGSGTVPTSTSVTLTDTLTFDGGQVTLRGSNTSGSSYGLLVENSSGTDTIIIQNDNKIGFGVTPNTLTSQSEINVGIGKWMQFDSPNNSDAYGGIKFIEVATSFSNYGGKVYYGGNTGDKRMYFTVQQAGVVDGGIAVSRGTGRVSVFQGTTSHSPTHDFDVAGNGKFSEQLVTAGRALTIESYTSASTLDNNVDVVFGAPGRSAFSTTMPPSPVDGQRLIFRRTNSSIYDWTLLPNSGQSWLNGDGTTSNPVIGVYLSRSYIYLSSVWHQIT